MWQNSEPLLILLMSDPDIKQIHWMTLVWRAVGAHTVGNLSTKRASVVSGK